MSDRDDKILKQTGKATTDAERQRVAKEWNMLDTSGKALTEEETERLLKQTYRK